MTRCPHCKKMTHSENLYVFYKKEDFEKVHELTSLDDWTPKFMYRYEELNKASPQEYGKLKCGDIYIHFVASKV